jgi:hypothetical protein
MIEVIVRSGRGTSGSASGSTLWLERGVKLRAKGVSGVSISSLGSTSSDAIEDMLKIGGRMGESIEGGAGNWASFSSISGSCWAPASL